MSSILEVDNISVAYGRIKVLQNLSVNVRQGEILGVIGPNGAGKTTLLNALIGLVRPQNGKIIYEGKDITALPPAKRCKLGFGRTYQVPRPFSNMTVYENVLVGAAYGAALSEKQGRIKSLEILTRTSLMEKKHILAGKLTLLDRKRLEVARALATNPRILLLDEVAAGLTEAEVQEVMKLVKAIKEEGVTIVWIEHVIITMLKATDRLLCLSGGTNLLCGDPKEVMTSKVVEEVYLGVEEN